MRRKIDVNNAIKCEKCGYYRWKTIKKNVSYQCRNCKEIKHINQLSITEENNEN